MPNIEINLAKKTNTVDKLMNDKCYLSVNFIWTNLHFYNAWANDIVRYYLSFCMNGKTTNHIIISIRTILSGVNKTILDTVFWKKKKLILYKTIPTKTCSTQLNLHNIIDLQRLQNTSKKLI